MMPNSQMFHINYYVGPLLALVGELRVDDQNIVFKPTGPIERAMGARDLIIPVDKIIVFESIGGLSRTVRIKVADIIYKFEGSEASRFGEWLIKKLPTKAYRRPSGVTLLHPTIGPKYSCRQCTEVLQPGFAFCTRCGAHPSPACAGCQRMVDFNWTVCGYCGVKVTLPVI